MAVEFRANRAYPSIPTVVADINSLVVAVQALKAAVEIHERRTRNIADSFVRVRELEDVGLITVIGNQLNQTSGGADATTVHNTTTGRDAPDSHPISAITGLEGALAALGLIDVDFETRISDLEAEILATFATRVDDVGGTLFYIGTADPGSVEGDSVWRIQRITFTDPGNSDDADIEWADGDANFDNIWTNRLALSYS